MGRGDLPPSRYAPEAFNLQHTKEKPMPKFFLNSMHFFKILKKGGGDLPPPPLVTRLNTVMLDTWWNILITFSKQIANTFAKIIYGSKGEFKILSNI